MSDTPRRKLIEVALPLEAINHACKAETENPFLRGHPRAVHTWWARIPLVVCRIVLFASLVDDPSARPEEFSSPEEQDTERERLFALVARLAEWGALKDERLLSEAREEILRATHGQPPPVLDPFCGRGSIPLEAQRLGLQAYASDLNPVAVLITKAVTELPPRVHGCQPVNPKARDRLQMAESGAWPGLSGFIDDLAYYGERLQREVARRVGDLYPQVESSAGSSLDASIWLWARTVQCPNPACGAEIPLVRSFTLSKKGDTTWLELEPSSDGTGWRFMVRHGQGKQPTPTVNRQGARCLACEEAVAFSYIRDAGIQGKLRHRLLAIVAQDGKRRVFLAPNEAQEKAADIEAPPEAPATDLPDQALGFRVQAYGLRTHADLFTPRQLTALVTACHVLQELREEAEHDAVSAGMERGARLSEGGTGGAAYADAISTYLGLAIGRWADYSSTLTTWNAENENVRNVFQRHAVPMVWDYAEANPGAGTLSLGTAVGWVTDALGGVPSYGLPAVVRQLDAVQAVDGVDGCMVATDPPYYENIGYADLSDFFYVWHRLALNAIHPELFSTVLTPKQQELIASRFRFNGRQEAADEHFETGLKAAFERMRERHHPDFPMTVIYAFKQSESDSEGTASRGWEAMLEGLLGAGLAVTGTWPMRTTKAARAVARNTNALASAVILVCRARSLEAPMATRKEFVAALRRELPAGLRNLQQGSVAPADFAQAAIGPGMAIFSRYSKVVEADGKPMRVRTALTLINDALDELLAEQEADFDADTRWCVAWFEQHGMNEGPFGVAETLSRAKNTAMNGLVSAGVVQSAAGKVRLLDRGELEAAWDPGADPRLTVWEVTQHLIARHQSEGEEAAAELLRQVGGGLAEAARELAYRLFAICERKDWAQEALAYNALVTAWPEITRLAAQAADVSSGRQEAMEV